MRPLLVLATATAACTPHAVTPGARTFVMDSPLAPEVGHHDAQIDIAGIGQLWGPELVNGNARLRRTVSPGVVLEGEAGILHVTNAGTGGDRNGYTGRVGVLLQSEDRRAALAIGAGGGTSLVAGSWGSADIGGMLTGKHAWIRPVLAADIGYSAPFGDQTFTVAEEDGTQTTLRLPRNIIAKVSLGLELGDRAASMLIGVSMVRFYLSESSVVDSVAEDYEDDGYLAAGLGIRFALD